LTTWPIPKYAGWPLKQLLHESYPGQTAGNRVILNPNGITTFQFADTHVYGFESMVRVAEGLGPF
jgi:hypothetical protein